MAGEEIVSGFDIVLRRDRGITFPCEAGVADVPTNMEESGLSRGESGGEGTLEVHLLVECPMDEAGMRLR